MLRSPFPYDSNFIEGTVLAVDVTRYICSVKTINGKILREVRWLVPTGGYSESGTHVTPNLQDRVLITTTLTYPLILGCIPRIDVQFTDPVTLSGATATPDIGTDSSMRGGVTANPNKPIDHVPHDFVYMAKGGAQISILSQGAAILKASPLAQLIMSKYEGLVRLVTRNYQRFSDASSNVSANMKGRLYEWFGADWEISRNRTSHERYQEIYGDVAAGEVLLGNPDPSLVVPATDTRVRKQWLRNATGGVIMIETLYQDGSLTFFVTNAATPTATTNTTTVNNGQWATSTTDGTNTTSVTITPASTIINSTNGTTPASVTISPTNILCNYNNVSKATLNASQAKLESNGHAVTITSTGVAMT